MGKKEALLLDEVSLERTGWRSSRPLQVGVPHNGAGDVRLVDGRAHPALQMAAGTIERWRIINVSFGRCIRLSIGGEPFQILGTDGGFLSWPVTAREVLLAPGNRIDLAVGPFAEGTRVHVQGLPLAPGDPVGDFATVRVGARRISHAWVPKALKHIDPLVAMNSDIVVNQTVRLAPPPRRSTGRASSGTGACRTTSSR